MEGINFNDKKGVICDMDGVSTKETLKTFAYRPTMVLDGVGDIVKLASR